MKNRKYNSLDFGFLPMGFATAQFKTLHRLFPEIDKLIMLFINA